MRAQSPPLSVHRYARVAAALATGSWFAAAALILTQI